MNTHAVAVELEFLLCKEFGFNDRPSGTAFNADAIENYFFYDAMCLLLYKKNNSVLFEFEGKYIYCKNKNINSIKDAEQIFDHFKSLIDE